MKIYGITKDNLYASLKHASIITVIGIIVVTFLGYQLGFKPLKIDLSWLFFYVAISVPLQEFVFRGFIQTKLYRLGTLLSISISSVLYAFVHFPNALLIALTLTAGLAWGYSFYKAPTLVGPIVSHAILGVYLFLFVL